MSNLYIIAGCNGAGKTTASETLLPEVLDCREFVNADAIAAGLSPFQPETVAFEAGRLMLQRINHLLETQTDFAFETTLAAKTYVSLVKEAQSKGYIVTLLYFWLESAHLAKTRVQQRVSKGGHNIPPDVIEQRYKRGIWNFFNLYIPIVDKWALYDNSTGSPITIAQKKVELDYTVIMPYLWNEIRENNVKEK